MKKFLFSIFAVAMAMTASASDIVPTVETQEIEGTTYKAVVFTLTNTTEATALQLNFNNVKPADIVTWVDGEALSGTMKVKEGFKTVDVPVFTGGYSETSNQGCPIYYTKFNVDKSKDIQTIPNGVIGTLYFPADSKVVINLTGITSNKSAVGEPITPATIDLGTTSGIQNVNATSVKEGKFIENGSVVIVKNGKKFNAAGAQMK